MKTYEHPILWKIWVTSKIGVVYIVQYIVFLFMLFYLIIWYFYRITVALIKKEELTEEKVKKWFYCKAYILFKHIDEDVAEDLFK